MKLFLTKIEITASTAGILLTQKNCYKVLESVYGSEEKTLVNRVFKKVKEHIEWEKEVSLNIKKFIEVSRKKSILEQEKFICTLFLK